MKALFTKYLPCTNHHPSRIKAFDEDGHSVTMSNDEAQELAVKQYPDVYFRQGDMKMSTEEATHRVVVEALCKKMNWSPDLIAGGMKNGFVFVFR